MCVPIEKNLSTLVLLARRRPGTKHNHQQFVFRCPQEHENNMHSFLYLTSNSCGIHVYYDEVCAGFLYNLCWCFSDISPDTPSHTTRECTRNNRVFVIVVNTNFTSCTASASGLHMDLRRQRWNCFHFYPLFPGTGCVGGDDAYLIHVFDTAECMATSYPQCKVNERKQAKASFEGWDNLLITAHTPR